MDMFGDSDTTSDGEDDDKDNNIGVQDVQPAAEAVDSPPPAPAGAAGAGAGGAAVAGAAETKGEDPPLPPHPPQPPPAAQPVKTLPRPVYEGDQWALITLCSVQYRRSSFVDKARDLMARPPSFLDLAQRRLGVGGAIAATAAALG